MPVVRTPARLSSRRARARGVRAALRTVVRWLAALVLAWFALCVVGLVYLRYSPPLVTALQLQRWLEYGDPPASISGAVPLADFGRHLPRAVIVAEDARFFEHGGVDWEGMQQAVEDNLKRGRLWRGGSTITQQLVKNLYFPTFWALLRKPFEIPLSLLAELILPKERVLELYLNVVEWGPGLYGGEDAARHYYGVPAAALNREQAARLAACLPAPRTRRPQHMDRYAAVIRRRMASVGW